VSILRRSADSLLELLAPFPLLRRLTHAAGWTMVGTVIGSGLTFIAMIGVARILGRDAFGELGILQSTVAMFQVFAAVGLGTTAMKHVAEYRVQEPKRAGHIIAISDLTAMVAGGIAAVVVLILAPWLAANVLVRPALEPLLRIAAVTIALSSWNGALNGALGGMEEFRSIAFANFISGLAAFPLVLGGAFWKGIEGVVIALAAQAFVTCLLLNWLARRKAKQHGIPIALRGAGEWSVLWRFSLPAMLAGIAVAPAEWLCNAMLVRHSGYSQMGFYTAAMQWRNVLMFIPIMIVQSALPVFASVKSAHGPDSEEYRRLMVVSQSSIMLLIFPVATLIMLLSREVFRLYGATYVPGSGVLAAMCFMVITVSVGAGFAPAIEAWGNMWAPAAINWFWGVIYVLLVRATVQHWGAEALPFSAGAGYVLMMYANLAYFRGKFPKGTGVRTVQAHLTALAVVALCFMLSPTLRIWLALPCSVIILLLTLFHFSDRELVAGTLLRTWETAIASRKDRSGGDL
jgi:O-antigen/teichoic acid export membrane protein